MKTCALAALLVTAPLSCLVAGSASATTLCEESIGVCPAGKRYMIPTKFQAQLVPGTAFKLTMGKSTVECNESEIAGETLKNLGPETWIVSELGVWTLSQKGGECINGLGKCPTAHWSLPMKPFWISHGGNGAVLLQMEGGSVSFEAVCGGMKCIYAGTPSAAFRGGGAGEALLEMVNEELKKAVGSNALCANEAFVNFDYAIKTPANALWIAYSP